MFIILNKIVNIFTLFTQDSKHIYSLKHDSKQIYYFKQDSISLQNEQSKENLETIQFNRMVVFQSLLYFFGNI